MSTDSDIFEGGSIDINGAREHNLKDLDLKIPRGKLVVFTGLSGSGKSSLAFDTIFAEGQRRYMETFSAYARQFIGDMKRPDVDKIDGLSPVIAIEQKTVSKNPRSTVGTITEIYDFLRLLYARAGIAISHLSGNEMTRFSEDEIVRIINEKYTGKKIAILAPLIRARKGHYRELFEQFLKRGFTRMRVDGEIVRLEQGYQVDRYKVHDIELVIDRIEVDDENSFRVSESVKSALKLGNGVLLLLDMDSDELAHYSKFLMDGETGLSYDEPQPNTFSFNSPYGACDVCNGLGTVTEIDEATIIPDPKLSINKGGLAPLGPLRDNWTFTQIKAIAKKMKFSLADPIEKLDRKVIDTLLHGSKEKFEVTYTYSGGGKQTYETTFKGLLPMIHRSYMQKSQDSLYQWAEEFMSLRTCPSCDGTRIKMEARQFFIDGKHIGELGSMNISELNAWLDGLEDRITERQRLISRELLKEIRSRVGFLMGVGLEYLSLNNAARTLSGGEAQRIRLATQIGSRLEEVLYILDEPSIGLHQRDNERLIGSLKELRDLGNSVIVVEHDKDMIIESDYVVDIGPGAGVHGGEIVAHGPWKDLANSGTVTAQYLSGAKQISIPAQRRKGNGHKLVLKGATGNNLKSVDAEFPLGMFICVTGVSGSGKSTLINDTLHPLLAAEIYKSRRMSLPNKGIKGLQHIDKVIKIDQSPIGRSPRSNPATYVGFFTEIRNLFAELPEAKIRGYKPGRFSFNVKGGRCETCKGGGRRIVEMNFLPDVEVECETCMGRRYNRETLEVRYKGRSISDVLDMSVDEAITFFEHIPSIYRKIKALHDVGLGYITLGQSSITISGGEAQRVKLASELSKVSTGNTFYILDEPTTGLHFEDVRVLLDVLQELVNLGNTVLVIEHNLDVIKIADHIMDLGPEGGRGGGEIIACGTPEQIVELGKGHTARFLKQELVNTH
ncbi:MAG: excinuclease ABC subunit UvrA [Flavobacteriales bacterium]|nr:excinuclease ABC subunit UvrA [Flavobacteriales bacterium]